MDKKTDLFIIATRKHGPLMFWRKGGFGYTPNRSEAGVFNDADSREIVENSALHINPSDRAWRININDL